MAQYYIFTTAGGNPDPLNASNYSDPQDDPPTCPGSSKICSILAEDNGFSHPVITSSIRDEMVRALQFGSDQTNVLLRS